MHRLILSARQGEFVDHIDGNKLNNVRSNLRLATKAGNQRNQRIRSDNTSGFRGVYWCKKSGKWRAQITVNNKRIALGSYDDAASAASAYNEAALRLHGEFAKINYISKRKEDVS
ncbi:AP2 domain-containing protein [Brevibacillus agri]|uniref:AP2 domain-containing protein n=1 Tax=Brevibacillus agri TaxID=51101 RepID=UPI003B75C3F5